VKKHNKIKSKTMKKLLQNLANWGAGIFKDEKGTPSSKRLVGVACATTLCITMYHNSFSTTDIAPADSLVDAVALLAFGCLGLSSIDKFTAAKKSMQGAVTRTPAPVKKEETVEAVKSVETDSVDSICVVCNNEPCSC
jgi:hypothetical protein